MREVSLKNATKIKCLMLGQRGQAMVEYIVVCALMAMVLIIPFQGKRLYVWVIDALRLMHQGYMASLSVYAYPF